MNPQSEGRVPVQSGIVATGLILVQPGEIELREYELPALEPGDLAIRVQAATTCGTDLKAFLRGHPQIPMPGSFGHEYSGTVVATGEGAKFEVGAEIMGVHTAPCGACRWCGKGQENLCESIMASKVLGTFATHVVIPKRIADLNVFRKPQGLSYGEAALIEPLACVAEALRRVSISADDEVLVIGPGAIGLMFVRALKHMGVKSVVLAGRNAERLSIGAKMGAECMQATEVKDRYDVVIECTGRLEIWMRAIEHLHRGGLGILYGGPPAGSIFQIDTHRWHYDDLRLISPFHFTPAAVRDAYRWLTEEQFDLSSLLTGERDLRQATETFRDLEQGRGIKYVFNPSLLG